MANTVKTRNISEMATDALIIEKKSLTDTRLMWLNGNLPLSAEQMAEVDARGCAVAAELAKRFAPTEYHDPQYPRVEQPAPSPEPEQPYSPAMGDEVIVNNGMYSGLQGTVAGQVYIDRTDKQETVIVTLPKRGQIAYNVKDLVPVESVPPAPEIVSRPAEIQTVSFEMGGKQYQTRSSWELLG